MKKIFLLLICIFVSCGMGLCAEQTYTLKTGISMEDRVPKGFYGTWRVQSTRVSTNNQEIYKSSTVDLWNLSRNGNVITLENPFTGAKASIKVSVVDGQTIRFKKIGDFEGKKLSDEVQLKLNGDRFSGENYLILETISDIDKSVIKREKATYKLSGEKISGSSIK